MRTLLRLLLVAAVVGSTTLAPASARADDLPLVLVLTEGNDESAEYAVERLEMEARRWNFELAEGDPSDLADLSGTDVVLLLGTRGEIFNAEQEAALQEFVESGGGLVGTHAAVETQPDWDWLRDAFGAAAAGPPSEPPSQQEVSFSAGSPITAGLTDDLELTERWYDFDPAPADNGQNVLATYDGDKPVAWNSLDQRVFYTAAGGEPSTWGERDFLQLMRQAIWWSSGAKGDLVQNTDDVAAAWPYTWTFVFFVLAVAGGGSLAVWRLDRAESAKAAGAAPEREREPAEAP